MDDQERGDNDALVIGDRDGYRSQALAGRRFPLVARSDALCVREGASARAFVRVCAQMVFVIEYGCVRGGVQVFVLVCVFMCVCVLVGVFAGNVCSFGYMSMTIYAFVLPQAMCVCTLCINLQVF